jgi:chromate reductase
MLWRARGPLHAVCVASRSSRRLQTTLHVPDAASAVGVCMHGRRHLASSTYAAGVAGAAPLNTVVLVGSTREKRIGSKVASYMVTRLEERGHAVTVLDPRTASDGFFMQLMEKAFFHYKPDEEIPSALVETAAVLRAADAFVVVTPEMNHTIAPGLTNMMNYFGSSLYAKRPSGIATYSAGMWGGARCAVALRAYLSELGCLPVSATFQQAGAWKKNAFDEDGMLDPEGAAAKSASRMIEQLEWHAHAMRNARALDSS